MEDFYGKQAKHFKEKKKSWITITIIIVVIVIIATTSVLLWLHMTNPQPPTQYEYVDENNSSNLSKTEDDTVVVDIAEPEYNDEIVDVSDFPDKINNYDVVGKIILDRIHITSYILGETSEDSLKYGVTKFWGPEINTVGNYCITGHNYKKVFGPIYNLRVGDTFDLIRKRWKKSNI